MSSWYQHLDEAPFRQYYPLKPGQCSIKIFWYCDTKIPYSLASEFNVGKQPGQRVPVNTAALVKRLVLLP
ncbi:hypothetical protein T06_2088 [Trichinella sp. T6]|nr:hypothetical protein T06_2088 [Trichinella sp. T6]